MIYFCLTISNAQTSLIGTTNHAHYNVTIVLPLIYWKNCRLLIVRNRIFLLQQRNREMKPIGHPSRKLSSCKVVKTWFKNTVTVVNEHFLICIFTISWTDVFWCGLIISKIIFIIMKGVIYMYCLLFRTRMSEVLIT